MGHHEAFLVRDWLKANGVRTFIRADPRGRNTDVGVWVLESDAATAEKLFYTTEDPRITALRRIPWYHQHSEMGETPSPFTTLLPA